MMNKRFLLFIFSILLTGSLLAQTDAPAALFQRANRLYQAEKYQQALEAYKKVTALGYENAALYYNMGNCYYRLNRLGKAILYYEKARKLAPDDPDILYNLKLANLKIIDQIQEPPRFFLFRWWDALKNYYSIGQLSRLLPFLFVLAAALLIAWLFVRRDRLRRAFLTLAVLAGLFVIFWGYIYLLRVQELQRHNQAVVLQPSVTILSAPDENSEEMFVLHEGVKVKIDQQQGDWLEISLPDGKSGWIQKQALGII